MLLSAWRFRARAVIADIESKTAESWPQGKIVARAKGAMEFGARALGNRSILARADSPTAVRDHQSNDQEPGFLDAFRAFGAGRARRRLLLRKPKPVASPYMMFAFRSRPEKRAAFAAAQHPYDFTTRPQEVTAEHNPDYYRLLKEYEAGPARAIVLNTSFNLHGEPMVYRARDAVDVFLRSGLEHMALANWWVEKAAKIWSRAPPDSSAITVGAAAGRGPAGLGHRQSESVLRSRLEARAAERLRLPSGIRICAHRYRRPPGGHGSAVRAKAEKISATSFTWRRRRACGIRSRIRMLTWSRISLDFCTCSKAAGGAGSASDLRFFELGLWRQHQRRRFRRRTGGLADFTLCGQQACKELMAHCYSHLFGIATHWPALLHGVWAMGAAGYGSLPLRGRDSGGPGDRSSITTAACGAISPT